MKKLILFISLVGSTLLAAGQSVTYNPFKLDITAGISVPLYGYGNTAGAVASIQPHFLVSDNFSLGLRYELADCNFKIDPVDTWLFGTIDSNHGEVSSLCITGEYYLPGRFFVGGGLGFYSPTKININTDPNSNAVVVNSSATNFGFFPEAGFESGHFRMSVDYNVAGSNSNYLSLNIGFFLGGGKKGK